MNQGIIYKILVMCCIISIANGKLFAKELPDDFPPIEVTKYQEASEGVTIFATNGYDEEKLYGSYLIMLDKDLNVLEYKRMPGTIMDFKIQDNGLYSFYCNNSEYKPKRSGMQYIMNKNLELVDSLYIKNSVTMSAHEFLLLPNGHKVMLAHNPEYMDLSEPEYGGNPNAAVTNSVIHEYDENGKLIFQWNAKDYIDIKETYQPIKNAAFMSPHLNGIEIDRDGNFLCSFRWINQLIKINRSNGEIMWRAGGKNNEFTFINEHEENAPDYFSLQHDVRRLDNGNITLFDNGNSHKPASYSRGVEYKIDEVNKTMELVSENVHDRKVFGAAQGSMQRLENGNAIVGWANAGLQGEITCSEFDKDGHLVWDVKLPKGMLTYRAKKYNNLLCDSTLFYVDEVAKGAYYRLTDLFDVDSPFEVMANDFQGIIYNKIMIYQHECSEENPKFEGLTPDIAPGIYSYTFLALTYLDANIRYDLSKHNFFKDKSKIIVYFKANGEDTYKKIPSTYNLLNKTLEFNLKSKGRFVFAIENIVDKPNRPLLKSPMNGETMLVAETPVEFRWNSNGLTDQYTMEIATEPEFINTVKEVEQDLSVANVNLAEGTYYWRAKATNSAGESEWSETSQININSQSYVTVLYPSGGEDFTPDSSEIISWTTNTKTDSVRIILTNLNTNANYEIFTSAYCPMSKIKWKVSSELPRDSNYVITVYRLTYSEINLYTVIYESGKFSIGLPTSVRIENYHTELFDIKLNDNTLNVHFFRPTKLNSVSLYDMNGNNLELNIQSNSNGFESDLSHLNLTNGVYFLNINSNYGSFVSKILKAE